MKSEQEIRDRIKSIRSILKNCRMDYTKAEYRADPFILELRIKLQTLYWVVNKNRRTIKWDTE